MTARLPFTEASVRRLIRACERAGKRVTAVKPDGTVILEPVDKPTVPTGPDATEDARWADTEA